MEQGKDYRQIKGTGPEGRIVYNDVIAFTGGQAPKAEEHIQHAHTPSIHFTHGQAQPVATQPSKTVTPATPSSGDYVDLDVSNVRKVIADRLLLSKTTIPHFYISVDCNMDKVIK